MNLKSTINMEKNIENVFASIVDEVAKGARFSVDFKKRVCRVNGKVVLCSDDRERVSSGVDSVESLLMLIEMYYCRYKRSVPSERSEHRGRSYFKALPERELSDHDMMYGEQREEARCRLELTVLIGLLDGTLAWQKEWGNWFWQSDKDKDLVILREWVEPCGEQ